METELQETESEIASLNNEDLHCSESCGMGTKKSRRKMLEGPPEGKACLGNEMKIEPCMISECPGNTVLLNYIDVRIGYNLQSTKSLSEITLSV